MTAREGLAAGFAWEGVASELHDRAALDAALAGYAGLLAEVGGTRATEEGSAPEGSGASVFWVQTGGVENRVLEAWRRGGKRVALLLAHPLHNSLPAALESLARILREGGAGRVFFMKSPGDRETIRELAEAVAAAEADARLARDGFGRIGESSDWLVASAHPLRVLEERFGCRVAAVPMERLQRAFREEPPPEDGAPEWRLWEAATSTEGVSRGVFAESVRVARALRHVAREEGLTALTVRCFDLLLSERATGCLALSLLADEDVTAACEGDIPAMVALRWLKHLTGQAGWMANPSALDPLSGEVRLAHCTVPLSMVERHAFKTHFESGIGLGIDGEFAAGPVTLVRLGGDRLDRWWGAEGELVAPAHDEGLCRTQVRLRVDPAAVAEWLASPLGNHVVMVRGHWKAAFARAFEWMDTVRRSLPSAQ